MSRYFSSTARALLKIIWKGTEEIPEYNSTIHRYVTNNTKLKGADTVTVA
jgi:hypothetical protein